MREPLMTWIKTVPPTPDHAPLLEALAQQAALYPPEYDPAQRGACRVPDIVQHDSIVLAHSLIPPALAHAFATFGVLMEDTFDMAQLTGEARLLFEHAAAQTRFGASVFWLRRLAVLDDEQSMLSYWQITREGHHRGIVEIILELP